MQTVIDFDTYGNYLEPTPIHDWAEVVTRADEFTRRLDRIREVHNSIGGICPVCNTETPCPTARIAWGLA